ncbi:MAG: PAS domain S-box protein, partial [Ignavibacteriaceae bacterium]|nr:PAS domain S-box protein [Ignavibacteriaceae bacterium]
MNVFAFFDLLNIILAVFLCSLVYFRDPSGKLNKYFIIITLVSAYCALCEFFRLITPEQEWAIFWSKASFLWPFLPFIFYQFILVQTESKLYSNKLLNLLFFLPGLFIVLLHLFTNLLYQDIVHQWYGWEYKDNINIYAVFVAVFFAVAGILSVTIAINYFIKQNNERKRKQSFNTILGFSIPVLGGMITKGILPQFDINTPPLMASFYLIGSIFLAISILKYKSFQINPFDIIKRMFATSPDYLLIYNNNREVILASNSFFKCTAYTEDEIVGRKLNSFFRYGNHPEDPGSTERIGQEVEMEIITKDNATIPVSVTSSVMQYYGKKGNFYLLLGRDLSERKRFEKQLIQFKIELEEKIKIRTAELAKSNIDLHMEIRERRNIENTLKESEKRYRDLFENSPIGIYRVTPHGKFLMANPVLAKMLGYESAEELKAQYFNEGRNRNIYARQEVREKLDTEGSITGLITKWKKKDGTEIFIKENAASIRDENENLLYYEGTIEDISEQVKATNALKESEEKFRSLSEQSPNLIFIYQYNKVVYINKKCIEVLGYNEEYFLSPNFSWKNLLSADSLKRADLLETRVRSGENLTTGEYSFQKQDGQIIEGIISFNNINYIGGPAILGILTDITYRVTAENALKESEERFRNLIENINEIYHIADSEGRTIYASPNIYNFTGYPVKDWMGKKVLKFVYEEDLKRVLRFYIENRNKRTLDASIEFRSVKKDGTIFWVEQITRFVRDNYGRIIEYRSVTRDITKRKITDEKLQLLAQAVKSSSDGISISDLNNNLLFVNDAFMKIYGYTESELIGKNIEIVRSSNSPDSLSEELIAATNKGGWHGELINKRKDKTEFPIFLSTSTVIDDKGNPYAFVGITRDISERKKFEKAIRESENRYRNLFNNSPLGIYRTTPDGRILLANPAIIKMLGYNSLQELVRRDLEKEGYGEYSSKRSDFKNEIEKYGEVKGIEVEWIKKDGSTIILRENAKCVKDENNNVLYYDGTVEDITEQVNALNALKESEEKFRTLSEKSPNVILIVKNGHIIYINEKCLEVLGLEKEYFTSSSFSWENIMTHESFKRAAAKFGTKFTEYSPEPGEYTILHKSGKEIEIIVTTTPINYLGETATMAILTDITEHRKVEKQLEEYKTHLENLVVERTQKLDNVNKLLKEEIDKLKIAEESIQDQVSFLNILLDTIPNPIFIRDAQKHYTGCNKAFEEFHGIKKENILGKTVYECNTYEVAKAVDEWDDKLLSSRKAQNYEITTYDGEGNRHDVLVYKGFFNKADGTLGGMVGVILDISEIKKLQKEILKALDKEKELNELKSRFISVASHEFRTPLTSILAAADLLELYGRKWSSEKYYEYLKNIQNAVVYMNELINDVLTVNKSESEKIKFNPGKVNLYELLNGILDNAKLSAPGNISFIFDYSVEDKIFNLDSKLIMQILTNLLSNSIKYSPKGGNIKMEVTKGNDCLSFSVSDEGIGIPDEDQKLLFEP